jgi:hypothetical protein
MYGNEGIKAVHVIGVAVLLFCLHFVLIQGWTERILWLQRLNMPSTEQFIDYGS